MKALPTSVLGTKDRMPLFQALPVTYRTDCGSGLASYMGQLARKKNSTLSLAFQKEIPPKQGRLYLICVGSALP